MCMRPTTTVLATMKSEDFLYTCDGHLEDANFASKVKVTGEAIAEVKREWEERQVKQGKVKQGQVEQGKVKQVEQGKVKQGQVEQSVEQSQVKQGQVESQVNQVNQVESLQVKHEQYILHGDFFSSKYSLPPSILLTAPVRRAEHRRRREAAQARVLGVRLPRVPGR